MANGNVSKLIYVEIQVSNDVFYVVKPTELPSNEIVKIFLQNFTFRCFYNKFKTYKIMQKDFEYKSLLLL